MTKGILKEILDRVNQAAHGTDRKNKKTEVFKEYGGDTSIIYSNCTWTDFKSLQKYFEDSPGVRLFYHVGAIEILMPGDEHERFKGIIGMLLEIFFVTHGIEFDTTGSKTQSIEGVASAQADESYCIGESKPIPDLSIEVVFSSGGPNKLKRYKVLGVTEVWFWTDGLFELHRLRGQDYERIYKSEFPELAALDFDVLTQCVLIGETSRLEAARRFR